MKLDQQHFESKVQITPEGCWNWVGSKNWQGYGRIKINGSYAPAHRISYQLYVGLIPSGLLIRHKCDNPQCVNPDHLELGTHKDNSDDKIARGRAVHAKGEAHKSSKLTLAQVEEIRLLLRQGLRQGAIAASFGVCRSTVGNIATGRGWEPQVG